MEKILNCEVWDKRNRMRESRVTVSNFLLGRYGYNERGLRVKAERFPQPTVQVVQPNGSTNYPAPQETDLVCLSIMGSTNHPSMQVADTICLPFMGGEIFYQGDLNTINWSSMGVSGYLKLELLVNDTVAGVIADNVPAAQTSYLWPVGKTLTGWVNPGTNCKVRVSAVVPPSPPSTTYYYYDSTGRLLSEYDQAGVCVKDYLYLGSKMIGEFQPLGSKYYYYTSDQINSTRLVTDALGTVVYSAQYDPYGGLYKTWVDTWHPKPGFSGKERESSSEYDYFGARYYGHKGYRFLSVDPIINKDEAITNPQLWNLYSYCANNPISRFDPDGRESNFGMHWFYSQDNNAENVGQFFWENPWVLPSAAAVGAVGIGTLALVGVWEAAITVVAKDPFAIQNLISGMTGFLLTGPPDPNILGNVGWGLSILWDWNDIYGPGLKQTVSDIGKGLDTIGSQIVDDVTKFKNDATQFIMPKSYGPNYHGQ